MTNAPATTNMLVALMGSRTVWCVNCPCRRTNTSAKNAGTSLRRFSPFPPSRCGLCPKDLCPQKKWGRGRVKRKISAGGGLLFKGSGFYITDYRSERI